MRISNVKGVNANPNFIEVRHFETSLVNIAKEDEPKKSDFVIGFWRVTKRYFTIPQEYALPTHTS